MLNITTIIYFFLIIIVISVILYIMGVFTPNVSLQAENFSNTPLYSDSDVNLYLIARINACNLQGIPRNLLSPKCLVKYEFNEMKNYFANNGYKYELYDYDTNPKKLQIPILNDSEGVVLYTIGDNSYLIRDIKYNNTYKRPSSYTINNAIQATLTILNSPTP